MTGRAFLKFRIQQVVSGALDIDSLTASSRAAPIVALKAERKYDGPLEQFRIHRAMGVVAGFTPFHRHRGMFKYERAKLIRVALDAGRFVACRLRHQARALA